MEDLIARLRNLNYMLASCESITGGDFASRITDVSGASEVYAGGFVTYTDSTKIRLLGIPESLLLRFGSVSQEAVKSMAVATRDLLNCDIAIAFSGNAGPNASSNQPVGRVFTAIAVGDDCHVYQDDFIGSRKEIKCQTVDKGIQRLLCLVNKENMR